MQAYVDFVLNTDKWNGRSLIGYVLMVRNIAVIEKTFTQGSIKN